MKSETTLLNPPDFVVLNYLVLLDIIEGIDKAMKRSDTYLTNHFNRKTQTNIIAYKEELYGLAFISLHNFILQNIGTLTTRSYFCEIDNLKNNSKIMSQNLFLVFTVVEFLKIKSNPEISFSLMKSLRYFKLPTKNFSVTNSVIFLALDQLDEQWNLNTISQNIFTSTKLLKIAN